MDPLAREEETTSSGPPPAGSTAPVWSPLVGMVGRPEARQLPVESPGGHDDGHEAGGGEAQEDAHSDGGRAHHARY